MIIEYKTINILVLIHTKLNLRNLEAGYLVEYLNKVISPFGKRLLRNMIIEKKDKTILNLISNETWKVNSSREVEIGIYDDDEIVYFTLLEKPL